MAVQQNKKSPSKRGMHRAHDFLVNPPTAVEPTTGETHLRHHISPSGVYRGKKVVKSKDWPSGPRSRLSAAPQPVPNPAVSSRDHGTRRDEDRHRRRRHGR